MLPRFGLIVLISGGLVASAHAQDAAPADQAADGDASDAVARGLFQAGAAAFDAGQFAEALEHFQAAYARSPRPKLLYNIGQAADRLRQDELALDSFRRYLAEVPDAPGREAIEARVRVLEQAVSEKKSAEPPEPLPIEPVPESSPTEPAPTEPAAGQSARPFPWAPVAVLGAGVVAMVAGAAFGMTAKGEEDDYALLMIADEDSAKDADELLADAESHATLANVLLGAGAALSAVATVWLVLELTDDGEGARDTQVAAAPRLAPGELGFVLHGRFGGVP